MVEVGRERGRLSPGPRLVDYLPTPIAARNGDGEDETFSLEAPSQSIGRMGAFHGNFGALVRAWSYISTLGKEGIPQISEDAVINANYVLSQLRGVYDLPYDRTCMHEVVFSATNLKRQNGVRALDVAKRLIDYGIHPPTMYFPLIVDEALMIEPTETESKETLDYFIEVMKAIAQEAAGRPRPAARGSAQYAQHTAGRGARRPQARAKVDTGIAIRSDVVMFSSFGSVDSRFRGNDDKPNLSSEFTS